MIQFVKPEEDKKIFTFKIYYHLWDCDGWGWIYEKPDGTRYLVVTDHGDMQIVNGKGLEKKLKEYESIIADTKKALDLLGLTATVKPRLTLIDARSPVLEDDMLKLFAENVKRARAENLNMFKNEDPKLGDKGD